MKSSKVPTNQGSCSHFRLKITMDRAYSKSNQEIKQKLTRNQNHSKIFQLKQIKNTTANFYSALN